MSDTRFGNEEQMSDGSGAGPASSEPRPENPYRVADRNLSAGQYIARERKAAAWDEGFASRQPEIDRLEAELARLVSPSPHGRDEAVKRLWTWPAVLHGPPSRDPSKDGRIEVVRAEDYDRLAAAFDAVVAERDEWCAMIRRASGSDDYCGIPGDESDPERNVG